MGLAKREMEAGKVEPTNRLLSGSPIRSAMWSKISRLKRGALLSRMKSARFLSVGAKPYSLLNRRDPDALNGIQCRFLSGHLHFTRDLVEQAKNSGKDKKCTNWLGQVCVRLPATRRVPYSL